LIKLLPYILFKKYLCILVLEMASPGNQQCAICIGTLSFRISASKQAQTDERDRLDGTSKEQRTRQKDEKTEAKPAGPTSPSRRFEKIITVGSETGVGDGLMDSDEHYDVTL